MTRVRVEPHVKGEVTTWGTTVSWLNSPPVTVTRRKDIRRAVVVLALPHIGVNVDRLAATRTTAITAVLLVPGVLHALATVEEETVDVVGPVITTGEATLANGALDRPIRDVRHTTAEGHPAGFTTVYQSVAVIVEAVALLRLTRVDIGVRVIAVVG